MKNGSPEGDLKSSRVFKFTPEKDTWDGKYLFGGTVGVTCIIAYSHFIMYYFWACIEFYGGNLIFQGILCLVRKVLVE
jgi:delta24(24(1))-sterol reductase